jgi:transposase
MTPVPPTEALRDLSRDELIALILRLADEVQRLETEVERLKQPPPTSRNSSPPPSRDWKGDGPSGRKRPKKRGAKPGDLKAQRPLVDNPARVIEARVTICVACGTDLRAVAPERILRRQVTELPEIHPVVIETQQHEVVCPGCQRRQRGRLPEGLEATRHFGPRLEALITYCHHEHHIGFERLQTILQDILGTPLSEGGEVAVLERAGQAAQAEAEAIGARVRQSAVIRSDETSAGIEGRNWWEWVFLSQAGEYHVIAPSRGQDVIETFMGDRQAEVWESDGWKPQLNAPAQEHQLGLPHQIRALQGVLDKRPRLRWAADLQALFRTAIHLHQRPDTLTARGFQRQVTCLEKRLDRLLARRVTGKPAATLLDRYRTHRASLLVFLRRADVPPDNHACERALRPSVIHRKVLGSFRSAWGAQAYAALTTVLNTAKRAGENAFPKLVGLMGQPVLHYLNASIA